MRFFEMHSEVLDSHPVTLVSFTAASSPIDKSSVTILLPCPPITHFFSSSHSSSHFIPVPISFLTAFDSPPCLTECFPTLNVSYSFPLYNPSTFLARALLLSTNSFSFLHPLFEPYSFQSFIAEPSNLFPSKCRAQSILVVLTLTKHISFLSYMRIISSTAMER